MDLGRAKLNEARKDLFVRWNQTKAHWDDPVSREFERAYLDPLEARLRSALGAMNHMAQVMQRLEQDCE